MSRILVVYYSMSGHTGRLAEDVARRCGADLEPIREVRPRAGATGAARALWDVLAKRHVALRRGQRRPVEYDLVALGTPVWAGRVSAPMRSWIDDHRQALPEVAFFCTAGGAGTERVFRQMRELCRREPVATLAVTERELGATETDARITRFAETLERPALDTIGPTGTAPA